ncbi:MAG: hypothetical protein EU547_06935 [Promethearchaeota archaeon]|nr:MAG: hypothetical protein EU547_06935 [Candidatus Lokiarchaeota archaeon]
MDKRQKYLLGLFLSFLFILLVIAVLYYYFLETILLSWEATQGIIQVTILTTIKIITVSIIGLYLIKQWFKQEDLYLSDLPFLTGLFFLILVPAKFLDLLSAFIKDYVIDPIFLTIVKLRFFLAILNLVPMIFLSIGMILFYLSLNENKNRFKDKNKREKTQKYIIIIIALIELFLIIIAPNYTTLFNIVPLLVIPSLIMIVWVFAFAHKNKKLTNINPLIVAIGFGLYLLTTIYRSLGQYIFELSIYIITSEVFEIITFIIIFIGLIKKQSIAEK